MNIEPLSRIAPAASLQVRFLIAGPRGSGSTQGGAGGNVTGVKVDGTIGVIIGRDRGIPRICRLARGGAACHAIRSGCRKDGAGPSG